MLKQQIDTNFPGVNQNSINWMKHYLNGGDDVGASWNGIADSVSGYTYNYSNQFEFDLSFGDLASSNLTAFGLFNVVADIEGTSGGVCCPLYTKSHPTFTSTPTSFDITVFRLPYPDLPGAILVRPQGARVRLPVPKAVLDSAADFSVTYDDIQYYESGGVIIPILDPNWAPDYIKVPESGFQYVTGDGPLSFPTEEFTVNGTSVAKIRGFSDQLAAWRMAGASMTMSIPVSEYYKNGTLVACTSNAPFWKQEQSGMQRVEYNGSKTAGPYHVPQSLGISICSSDLPTSYSEVSSVKNYHKFSANDGAYVVLHNSQGVFNFYNYEDVQETLILPNSYFPQYAALNATIRYSQPLWMSGSYYGLRVVTASGTVEYPIVLLNNRTIYQDFISHPSVPVFNIPNTVLSEWDVASVSTAINDQDKALQFSLKFNSYVECYISASSSLKPSVSVTSPYYPRLLEYLSAFYHTHDGIYPYSWNDGKKVWNIFKKFLQSDALAKMIGLVSPSAGQITSLIQSEVQRLANKQKVKDAKLTRTEKEQVKSIVSSITNNKKK